MDISQMYALMKDGKWTPEFRALLDALGNIHVLHSYIITHPDIDAHRTLDEALKTAIKCNAEFIR